MSGSLQGRLYSLYSLSCLYTYSFAVDRFLRTENTGTTETPRHSGNVLINEQRHPDIFTITDTDTKKLTHSLFLYSRVMYILE